MTKYNINKYLSFPELDIIAPYDNEEALEELVRAYGEEEAREEEVRLTVKNMLYR